MTLPLAWKLPGWSFRSAGFFRTCVFDVSLTPEVLDMVYGNAPCQVSYAEYVRVYLVVACRQPQRYFCFVCVHRLHGKWFV